MKATAAGILATLALIIPAGAARADTEPPLAGNQHVPVVCEFAQYACGGVQPTIWSGKPKLIRVHKGDTLWHLAEKWYGNGHEWPRLARMNHIKGTKIVTGQRLWVR
jgi:nucleoid-associated protein YgaU